MKTILASTIAILFAMLICPMTTFSAEPATTESSNTMNGESLVLVGTTPGNLIGTGLDPASVVVRSTYEPKLDNTVVYERDRDYTLDARAGTIARTADSRIPDFAKNMLYGKENFDHSQFPGYGNRPFTIYVDYKATDLPTLTTPTDASAELAKTKQKLEAGKAFKVIVFGDSISAGGESSTPELQFGARYTQYLQQQFPKAKLTFENGATGGDNTVQGLQRLNEKVLTRSPDLVLIGFGMNDHNKGGPTIDQFKANLKSLIDQTRDKTGADVILFSTFPPNSKWAFGSHTMEKYAAATKEVAQEEHVAYGPVFETWSIVMKRKDEPSMLANNINHPNDFGHWLYVVALEGLKF
jgi:lysophospholipase L1-like esterase